MFMKINTKEASEIYIAIPTDKVQYAQDMIRVFENNAVFLKNNYYSVDIVKPTITLELGNEIDLKKDNDSSYSSTTIPDFLIRVDGKDVVEHYEEATPEVLVSMKKALEHAKKLLDKEKDKVKCLESKIESLQEEIDSNNQEDN